MFLVVMLYIIRGMRLHWTLVHVPLTTSLFFSKLICQTTLDARIVLLCSSCNSEACTCACVIMENVALITSCSGNYHRSSLECFERCMSVGQRTDFISAMPSQPCKIVMKLYRCVVQIKMKAEFEKMVWSEQGC